MQTGRYENNDPLAGNPGLLQALQNVGQDLAIRSGTSDVANGDSCGLLPPRQVPKRGATDWRIQRCGNRTGLIGQRRCRLHVEYHVVVALGEFGRNAVTSKSQMHVL